MDNINNNLKKCFFEKIDEYLMANNYKLDIFSSTKLYRYYYYFNKNSRLFHFLVFEPDKYKENINIYFYLGPFVIFKNLLIFYNEQRCSLLSYFLNKYPEINLKHTDANLLVMQSNTDNISQDSILLFDEFKYIYEKTNVEITSQLENYIFNNDKIINATKILFTLKEEFIKTNFNNYTLEDYFTLVKNQNNTYYVNHINAQTFIIDACKYAKMLASNTFLKKLNDNGLLFKKYLLFSFPYIMKYGLNSYNCFERVSVFNNDFLALKNIVLSYLTFFENIKSQSENILPARPAFRFGH